VKQLFNSKETFLTSIASQNEPGRLIILTGSSGIGKTYRCLELINICHVLDVEISGLVSPPVFEEGRKVGVDLLDVNSNKRKRLAWQRKGVTNSLSTSHWQLDQKTLAWGNEILSDIETRSLFILDELGPLEFNKHIGLTAGMEVIAARRYRLGFVVIRPMLLEMACARWHWAQVVDVEAEKLMGALT